MQASQTASRNGDTKEGGGKSAVIRPKESRVGGPFISARTLKQGERDRRASAHACSRSPSVGQCFLSFTRIYWGSGSLRKNLRAICLLPPFCRSSLTRRRFLSCAFAPSPLSHTVRECDFNTILIRNHGTVEENNVPETKPFHLILFLRNGSMVRMRQLFQSTKYEMPAFTLTSPL